MFESIDNLKLVLNVVLSVDNFNNLRNLNDLLLDDLNFSNINISGVNLDDLFNFNLNFFNDFFSESDLDNLLNILFNYFVNLNQLWNNGFKFNNLVLFDHLFDNLFDFNYSWDFNH